MWVIGGLDSSTTKKKTILPLILPFFPLAGQAAARSVLSVCLFPVVQHFQAFFLFNDSRKEVNGIHTVAVIMFQVW